VSQFEISAFNFLQGSRRLPSGIGGNQKQAVDQGRLRGSRLFQEFRNLELVEAVMPGRLPFVAHEQPSGLRIEDKTPGILIGRSRPAPTGKICD
jgi:hypothetical protein